MVKTGNVQLDRRAHPANELGHFSPMSTRGETVWSSLLLLPGLEKRYAILDAIAEAALVHIDSVV